MEHQEWTISQYLRKKKKKRYAKGLVLREQLQINKDKCVIVMETLWSAKILPYKWCLNHGAAQFSLPSPNTENKNTISQRTKGA